MNNIRVGVFETNSSSTHSISICLKEEFERWKKGELVYNGNGLVEMTDEIKKIMEGDDWTDYETYNQYYDGDDCSLESYKENYTTKGGEELVAFGKYGYDG